MLVGSYTGVAIKVLAIVVRGAGRFRGEGFFVPRGNGCGFLSVLTPFIMGGGNCTSQGIKKLPSFPFKHRLSSFPHAVQSAISKGFRSRGTHSPRALTRFPRADQGTFRGRWRANCRPAILGRRMFRSPG